MHFIVTGAAGYLGSHMAKLLHDQGHTLTLIDNFCNSTQEYAEKMINWPNSRFFCTDITDSKALFETVEQSLTLFGCAEGIFHFAGLKSVDESIREPERYYRNNVAGTLNILSAAKVWQCSALIFSSSATVYGNSTTQPISESESIKPTNPYGKSKAMCEQILLDFAHASTNFKVAILRYFNPVGAHADGNWGENPKGVPANIMPYLCQVATGIRDTLTVFGDDYNTPDGSGVRDYIHVCDLIEGHWAAFQALHNDVALASGRTIIANLGTGKGASVLELIKIARDITGRPIHATIGPRRDGDVSMAVADTRHAEKVLNWKATRGLHDMIADHYRFTCQSS